MKSEIDLLNLLRPLVDKMFIYDGDYELISNCNSEYSLDPKNFIVSDGLINNYNEKTTNYPNGVTDEQSSYETIELMTCVRGANYIIICTINDDGSYSTDLRINQSTLNEYIFNKITNDLENIEKKYHDMNYFINEFRPKCLPQSVSIIEII